MTRPLRSTPITRASPLLRAGPPAGPATVLTPALRTGYSLSPPGNPNGQCRIRPSPVPCRSRRPGSRRLHAGHRLASQRAPARLVPGSSGYPGFDVTCVIFDTSTANRLRSPSRSPPDASPAPFPHRSPRSRCRSRSMWWFEASPRRATSKGRQSFISCTAPLHAALPTSNSLPRSGHTQTMTSPGGWAAPPLDGSEGVAAPVREALIR
jgi:hypothetical protein